MNAFISSLVALSTVTLASPLVNSYGFNEVQPQSGCLASSFEDQKVVFLSDDTRYSLFVPMDGKTYNIGGNATPDLNCVGESTMGGPCVSCDVEVDHTQILNAGTCAISINGKDGVVRTLTVGGTSGLLAFGTPGHPVSIACRPLHLIDREVNSGSLCPDTGGSSITLGVGAVKPDKFLMTVPADRKIYRVESPNEQLRCIGPIGNKYSMCLPCDHKINTIQVSEQAQTCSFEIEGYPYAINLNALKTAKPVQLETPGKLLGVVCGFPNAVEARTDESARKSVAEISIPWAFEQVAATVLSQTTCPSSGYHFAIANTAGGIYFPSFQADGKMHATKDLSCVALSDLSCASCANVGQATSITADYLFGPCTAKTEDGRTIEISHPHKPPQNTNLTPKVMINPPGVITQIKCGN